MIRVDLPLAAFIYLELSYLFIFISLTDYTIYSIINTQLRKGTRWLLVQGGWL